MNNEIKIFFSQGTLLVDAQEEELQPVRKYLRFDERVKLWRARACDYAPIVLTLHKLGIKYIDEAKAFAPLDFRLRKKLTPRDNQREAFDAWLKNGGRGVVVMPTGSGKTFLAVMAMNRIKRSVIVIVPTIDLMNQWAAALENFFDHEVGMLGGGSKEVKDITVSTYDSAVLQMEFIGNRFGMAVFDECHHLPGEVNRNAALMCIAPYRLGLTATPERQDENEHLIYDLAGPLAFRIEIDELEGKILAPYQTRTVYVTLEADELEEYKQNRKIYTDFIRANRINFRNRDAWSRFIGLCASLPNGRKVLNAYYRQKRIAMTGKAKKNKIWELINRHRGERIIIFTAENESAYEYGSEFLLPVLTHRSKATERKDMLDKFRSGDYPVLITSKVLNEGVDVPEASVGIVVSGSASIREHVQRLGRILRAAHGKQAVLYEIISEGTSEMSVSKRRREHRAYTSK